MRADFSLCPRLFGGTHRGQILSRQNTLEDQMDLMNTQLLTSWILEKTLLVTRWILEEIHMTAIWI